MPDVRTLDRQDKRKALQFVQKSNQLLSAIDVKDYAMAEKLVSELSVSARDFDVSKPMAAIETAKQISGMHIAKARNAAVSGDKETLEAELKAATENLAPQPGPYRGLSNDLFPGRRAIQGLGGF